MSDVRLMEKPYTIDGREYLLRCNMNVLAEVQEANGGTIALMLDGGRLLQSSLVFAAAMLNDYADEQGWSERYTPQTLGRKIPPDETMTLVFIVAELLRAAIGANDTDDTAETGAGAEEKNA